MTVTLRPDHDTTPHCEYCGAEGVPLATYPDPADPDEGLSLCEQCEELRPSDDEYD